MNRIHIIAAATVLLASAGAFPLNAQEAQERQPYSVGDPLGVRGPDGALGAISSNVKVYGAIYSAESCSYDAERGVIVVPNRGVPQNVQTNDGWVSFINHDGSVHTARWIGVQSPMARARLTPPLVLNEPFGSDIVGGVLYVVDRDGGTGEDDPTVAVIRRFDMRTGEPAGEIRVEGAPWLNDLEVADDGRGFELQQVGEGHLGLSIMRERAASVGGRVSVETALGQGTCVIVELPPRSE